MAEQLDLSAQVALKERLESKWLQHMEKLLDEGTITSTDMATLARVLLQNGWTLDASKIPAKLRDKLTTHVSPEELEDDVFPIHKRA